MVTLTCIHVYLIVALLFMFLLPRAGKHFSQKIMLVLRKWELNIPIINVGDRIS